MTDSLPRVREIAEAEGAEDYVSLDYEGRFLRRRRLESAGGIAFLVDLPEAVSVPAGAAFALEDGRLVEVRAAPERLLDIRGDLPRLAWHIGNRHTPCAVLSDRLLIRHDHVLADMLTRLGAEVTETVAPFEPEGGAYGHGRTFGHDHGHSHDHGEGHSHDHPHDHDHSHHDHSHGHDHG